MTFRIAAPKASDVTVRGDWMEAPGPVKLTKDDSPDHHHHWIPLSWVTRVDQHVHIDRPGDQAMREWLSSPPQTATAGAGSSSH